MLPAEPLMFRVKVEPLVWPGSPRTAPGWLASPTTRVVPPSSWIVPTNGLAAVSAPLTVSVPECSQTSL